MLGVTGIGAGVTFGTPGMAGMAVVCVLATADIVGATGKGSASCAGLTGAGHGTEMQCLVGACGAAVVVSGTVSAGLTLHSHTCHLMQQ